MSATTSVRAIRPARIATRALAAYLACVLFLPGCIAVNDSPIHTGWDQAEMSQKVQEHFWFMMPVEEAIEECRKMDMRYKIVKLRLPGETSLETVMHVEVHDPGVRLVEIMARDTQTLTLQIEEGTVRSAWYTPIDSYGAGYHPTRAYLESEDPGPNVPPFAGYPIALWERGS